MSKKFKFIKIISYISIIIFVALFQVYITYELIQGDVSISDYLIETLIVLAILVGTIIKKPFASLLVIFIKLLLPYSNLFIKESLALNLANLEKITLITYIAYTVFAFYFFNLIIFYFSLEERKYRRPTIKHLFAPLIVFIFVDIFQGGHQETIYLALPEFLALFLGADLLAGVLFLSVFANVPFIMAEEIPLGGLIVSDYIHYVFGLVLLLFGIIHLILQIINHFKKSKDPKLATDHGEKNHKKVLFIEEDKDEDQTVKNNRSSSSKNEQILPDEKSKDETEEFDWF